MLDLWWLCERVVEMNGRVMVVVLVFEDVLMLMLSKMLSLTE